MGRARVYADKNTRSQFYRCHKLISSARGAVAWCAEGNQQRGQDNEAKQGQKGEDALPNI